MLLCNIMQLSMKRTVLVCYGCISTPPTTSRNIDDGSLNCIHICLHASKQISLSLPLTHSLLFPRHHSQRSSLSFHYTSSLIRLHTSQHCTVINSFIREVRATRTSRNKNIGLQRPPPLCVFLLDNFIEIQFVVCTIAEREGAGELGTNGQKL